MTSPRHPRGNEHKKVIKETPLAVSSRGIINAENKKDHRNKVNIYERERENYEERVRENICKS